MGDVLSSLLSRMLLEGSKPPQGTDPTSPFSVMDVWLKVSFLTFIKALLQLKSNNCFPGIVNRKAYICTLNFDPQNSGDLHWFVFQDTESALQIYLSHVNIIVFLSKGWYQAALMQMGELKLVGKLWLFCPPRERPWACNFNSAAQRPHPEVWDWIWVMATTRSSSRSYPV